MKNILQKRDISLYLSKGIALALPLLSLYLVKSDVINFPAEDFINQLLLYSFYGAFARFGIPQLYIYSVQVNGELSIPYNFITYYLFGLLVSTSIDFISYWNGNSLMFTLIYCFTILGEIIRSRAKYLAYPFTQAPLVHIVIWMGFFKLTIVLYLISFFMMILVSKKVLSIRKTFDKKLKIENLLSVLMLLVIVTFISWSPIQIVQYFQISDTDKFVFFNKLLMVSAFFFISHQTTHIETIKNYLNSHEGIVTFDKFLWKKLRLKSLLLVVIVSIFVLIDSGQYWFIAFLSASILHLRYFGVLLIANISGKIISLFYLVIIHTAIFFSLAYVLIDFENAAVLLFLINAYLLYSVRFIYYRMI